MIFNKKNFIIGALAPGEREYGKAGGVHVTHKFTEVTNGHFVVRVNVPPKSDKELEIPKDKYHKPVKRKRINVVISKESAQKILRGIPGSNGSSYDKESFEDFTWVGRLSDEERTEFIVAEYGITGSYAVKNLEEKFPDIDNSIKAFKLNRKPKMRMGFNPEYMKRICDMFIKAKVKSVKMSVFDPERPMKLEATHDGSTCMQEISVILMPTHLIENNEKKKEEKVEETQTQP